MAVMDTPTHRMDAVVVCSSRFRAVVRELFQYLGCGWPCHARALAHGVSELGLEHPFVLLHQGQFCLPYE